MNRRWNMKCSIHRWNISRALDSGEPLDSLTKHHLVHCEACREFLRVGEEMGRRLADDASFLLKDERPALNDRVQRALDEPGLAATPPRSRLKLLRLRPVLAAAALLVVFGLSIIWVARSRPDGMPQLDPLLQLKTGRANLVSALQRAESPYQKAISELRKTLKSTADNLAARFDIGLGGESE